MYNNKMKFILWKQGFSIELVPEVQVYYHNAKKTAVQECVFLYAVTG